MMRARKKKECGGVSEERDEEETSAHTLLASPRVSLTVVPALDTAHATKVSRAAPPTRYASQALPGTT